jgi:hypothetical protein
MEKEKEKKDWFTELYPEVPSEYPPDLRIQHGKVYKVTFDERRPRLVTGGYGKKTAVINVSYKDELRSLYVGSNVDLARLIWNLWKNKKESLKGLTVEIRKVQKKGRNWIYEVKEVT